MKVKLIEHTTFGANFLKRYKVENLRIREVLIITLGLYFSSSSSLSTFCCTAFVFVFMFVCLNYFLLSPEPIEAIFRPIHSENRSPGVRLRYPPVPLKNNHLEYKHNYNHLVYKHNNAMNTNRTRMQLQMNIR